MKADHRIISVPVLKVDIHYSKGSWAGMMKRLKETYISNYQVMEYGKKIDLEYNVGTTGRVFVMVAPDLAAVDYWFWSSEDVSSDTGYCGWVAHEAMHLVTEIMRNFESPLIAETEEFYAYLLEWVVTEILSIDWARVEP